MAGGKLIELNEQNWEEEVINSDVPVLVDFWAIWCGPCKMIAPIVEELAAEYDGKFKIGKCDVDKNQSIAVKYGIRSIPTVIIYKDGEAFDTIIGAQPKDSFKAKMEEAL